MAAREAAGSETKLGRGDRLPRIVKPPPGARARAWAKRLERCEAPGVNTLPAGFGEDPSAEAPILWREARGANVLDVDGNRYLDLTAGFGVAAVGHRHPMVVAAIRRQAGRLLHGLGDVHAHPLRVELAERLGQRAPVALRRGERPRVHFAISGADAVEIALKTARLTTGRAGILAFVPGYHGMTLGALSVSSRPAFRLPFESRLAKGKVRRLPFGCPASRLDRALAGGAIGGVIVEPVVGREGVIFPPDSWLAELAAACRRHGALLIADEIFTGFGRTGAWFAVDHHGVRPDLLCCGKALGGGLPIAATLGRAELMAAWATPGEALHTATHLANPLACAAGLAVLDELEAEALPARAEALGHVVGQRLARWQGRSAVREIRGRGLLWGIEVEHRESAYRWARAALGRGLLILAGGEKGCVLQLCPPLTVTRRQLDWALDQLEETMPRG